MPNLSNHELKLLILRIFEKGHPTRHKYDVLGKPYTPGELERALKTEFSSKVRNTARKALEELVGGDFLRPTMSDLVFPDDWLEITAKRRLALARNALDELDEVLLKIDPHLVEIRRGAWSALASNHPDSLRQAAHSGRELIDQTLKLGAPNVEITACQDFVQDSSSKDGVTRRMRIRHLMGKYRGQVSESDIAVAEKAGDLVAVIDNKLTSASHARSAPIAQEVKDALTTAEIALRNVLTRPTV
jgi:broad specificity phosphatase PhoE